MSAPAMMPRAERPAAGPARDYRFPAFERRRLANGITILVAPVPKLPVVTVMALIDAGATADPVDREGLANLTALALAEGTESAEGEELTELFERLGTALETGADWDAAFARVSVLADRLPAAFALLAQVLTTPAFPEREIERLKAERLSDLLQLRTEPRGLANEMFDRFLYAPDSRYARPADGSERSIATLGREDVQRFYRARYLPGSVTLVFAGDVTTELAERLTMNSLGSWAGGAASPVAAADRPARLTRALHLVAKEDAPQSELRIGHVGLPRNHADYFPATVMNAVLGGLFSSRINLNLREAHAYTYGAFSGFEWRRAAGPWSVSTAVKSEITHDAARETLAEIDRIREAPIANDELTLATSYLDGVFPIRYETTTAIASALGNLVVYGLPDDYFDRYRANVRAVTVDDVLAAARRHIHPDALQLVVVGDPAVVLRPLETLGFGPVARYDAEGNAVEEGRRTGASV